MQHLQKTPGWGQSGAIFHPTAQDPNPARTILLSPFSSIFLPTPPPKPLRYKLLQKRSGEGVPSGLSTLRRSDAKFASRVGLRDVPTFGRSDSSADPILSSLPAAGPRGRPADPRADSASAPGLGFPIPHG